MNENEYGGSFCKCPPKDKHGQTAVMCCNHCGMPDEPFWQPPTDAVEEGEEIVVSMAGRKLKRDVDYSYENGVITIFNHNIN